MKEKKITVERNKVESKRYVGLLDERVALVSDQDNELRSLQHFNRLRYYLLRYYLGLLSVIASLFGALASYRGVSWLFSDLPQIPQAYASLIGIVVSSIVGISVTFLLARFIYQRRKAEMDALVHRIRSKERELFQMLAIDFDSITTRRELDAGQTN